MSEKCMQDMSEITLQKVKSTLKKRHDERAVQYSKEQIDSDIKNIHNDYLIEAISFNEDKNLIKKLKQEFESRNDLNSTVELAVEYVNRNFSDSLLEAYPRDLIDDHIRIISLCIEDELNGLYD